MVNQDNEQLAALLARGIHELGLTAISDAAQAKLLAYIELLQKWNQAFNLTAVRESRAMVIQHLLDSLTLLPYLHGQRILDVGSGAGLPGIPLAIVAPEREFVLLDSNGKKTRFMLQAQQTLALANLSVETARVEAFAPTQGFDSILTRAFGTLKDMLCLSQHLLNPNGKFLAMKGMYPEEEIQAIPEKFNLETVVRLHVPGLDRERHLVCIRLLSKPSSFA